jgi:hypothetical protein
LKFLEQELKLTSTLSKAHLAGNEPI